MVINSPSEKLIHTFRSIAERQTIVVYVRIIAMPRKFGNY